MCVSGYVSMCVLCVYVASVLCECVLVCVSVLVCVLVCECV